MAVVGSVWATVNKRQSVGRPRMADGIRKPSTHTQIDTASSPARELHGVAGRCARQPSGGVRGGGMVPVEQLFQGAAAVDVCSGGAHRWRACGGGWVGSAGGSRGDIWGPSVTHLLSAC